MKKLSIFFLIFLCILISGCSKKETTVNLLDSIQEKGKITVGIKVDSKPFGFKVNNDIKGFDADIARNISKTIFFSNSPDYIEFVEVKPYERISALMSGKADIIIATLSINEKRKAIIDFSIPYYEAGQALMVPKNSRINSINQLNNKKIAVVLGTTGEKTVRMLAPNATSIGASSYKEAFNYLKEGKVNAILADDSLLYGILADNKGYKILPARYTKEYYAIGIRKGVENQTLKKVVNSTVKNMQQSGKLNRIKEKWIPYNQIK